jgi:drug/metabolite transporter (DMT)-like permease
MFYYALKHLDTGKIAMLTLITPVTALMIGHWFNNERLDGTTIMGAALVLAGLLTFEGNLLFRRRKTVDLAG